MLLWHAMWTLDAIRPWKRLLAGWLVLSFLTVAVSRLHEVAQFGWSDAEGAVRLTQEVEQAFGRAARILDEATDAVAGQRFVIDRAVAAPTSLGELFAVLEAERGAYPDVSLTVYSSEGQVIAWSGRPSDIPRSRLTGPPTMLIAPGPLGPRLVAVRPVPSTPQPVSQPGGALAARAATVVGERLLPTGADGRDRTRDTVVWPVGGIEVVLRPRYEGAGEDTQPGTFRLSSADGTPLLEGRVRNDDVARARAHVRDQSLGLLILIAAACCGLMAIPLLAWSDTTRSVSRFTGATVLAGLCVIASRGLAWIALPRLAATMAPAGPAGILFRSNVDFCVTAAAACVLAMVVAHTAVHVRWAWRRRRQQVGDAPARVVVFGLATVAAGLVATAVFVGVHTLLRVLVTMSPVDLLRFSLHPGLPERIALETGLVLTAAAAHWLATTVLVSALIPFRVSRATRTRSLIIASWALPPAVWWMAGLGSSGMGPPAGILLPTALAITVASAWRPLRGWYRHASQGARLLVLFAALVTPVVCWYPGLFAETDRAKRTIVSDRLAPQAIQHRDTLQQQVRHALTQIDDLASLADLVQPRSAGTSGPVPTEAAFFVWSQTDLSRFRLTSSIELYGANGRLNSRFALSLPEYTSSQQVRQQAGCEWKLFEEVSPFGAEERRLIYAGRGICETTTSGVRVVGAVVIHAMLDYGDLPFISAQSPYVALVRGQPEQDPETLLSRDMDFVVYGWSRRPVYATGEPWILDDTTFRRTYASRQPFWAVVETSGRRYSVLFSNDRGGIYALGYPVLSPIGHMVNLAELIVLGSITFIGMALLSWLTAVAGGSRALRGRDILREIRASFYRKLFLAFVAAAAIPVLSLAFVARAYLTARLWADVQEAAGRTVAVAQRVVEDWGLIQDRGENRLVTADDDILVWIARVIDQDVNIFEGPNLVATSERSLYASGVLPARTPAGIYRAIVVERRATYVASERVGWIDYLVASAPVRFGDREAILTVPLTLRQQAIEEEIDELNRRILLAVVAFILAGSALGYWMAERIADPVSRLQRATARIARGDLTARVALTSSDELRRLVEAFNTMAGELQRQQGQLERTHRLEAWADMARQVAHEIKNPLTPIQLSAEHLRRVHIDRGAPLSPVLDSCVESILTQVRLLRQIAGEFSSFASSPTPRPVDTDVAALIHEVVGPYRVGLADRIALHVAVSPGLPPLHVDRTLIGRALTNIIDNALHAMPGGGSLTLTATSTSAPPRLSLTVTDTGVGMDAAAIARLFEPYFSTKATGTGLGLTIAKRNVELHGGTIVVRSTPGHGTTVEMILPRARVEAPPGACPGNG